MPKDRETYYQSIARHLFSLRGAPFFLSAREMEAVEDWEARGIRLDQVLEGMKAGYAAYRSRSGRRGRRLTLNDCHTSVLRAHAQALDRRSGRDARIPNEEAKREAILGAVAGFLRGVPDELPELEEVFREIGAELEQPGLDERRLEDWDAEVDRRLLSRISAGRLRDLAHQLGREHGVSDPKELERLAGIKWVKSQRDTFRVPYVSAFYY
jgi:hypothetical protein